MRLWTMLLSLAVVAVIAVNANAQDTKKRGERPRMSFADMDTNKDGKLDESRSSCEARLKNVPADRQEKAKEFVARAWKAIAGEKEAVTEAEFKAAMEKMAKERGGKKRGEKKQDEACPAS